MTRTPQHDAFLDAIAHDPDADTPRLVYADWLGEDHAEADPARAELIRVQVELAQRKPYVAPTDLLEIANSGRLYANMAGELISEQATAYAFRTGELGSRQSALLREHEPRWRATERCSWCVNWRNGKDWRSRPCPTCHGLGLVGILSELRTKRDVESARRTPRGCCSRHADNQACECLENAAELTWVRGFPRVSVPVAWFCHAMYHCPECGTNGDWPVCSLGHGLRQLKPDYPNARRLFAEQGYAKVALSDREPMVIEFGKYAWHRASSYRDNQEPVMADEIPDVIFDLMPEQGSLDHWPARYFHSRSAALAALSRACGRLGRETVRAKSGEQHVVQ